MIKTIKKGVARGFLPRRQPDSHKGQNGRLMIIGGSEEYYGAPILSGMAAFSDGVDLVYMFVPECNYEVTRNSSPNFIVRKFVLEEAIEFGKNCDAVLIGPGMTEGAVDDVVEILKNLHIPTVLDSKAILALKKINKFPLDQSIVITPHRREFENLVDREILVKEDDPKSMVFLRSMAMDLHINILLKGPVDYVCSYEGAVLANRTGNAGMTVGGSGDVLAGATASLLAQGVDSFEAAQSAAYFCGAAGDFLYKQKGVNYTAAEIAEALSFVMQ